MTLIPTGETGSSGSDRGPREPEVEGEHPLELGLDQRLVVGEHEPGARRALAQLRRVCHGARVRVGVVGRLAVGDVQRVGRLAGIEAGDRGVRIGTAERRVDGVVGVQRAGLPALRIQQPLAVGVQVGLELRLDPVDQALHRLRLGLRRRARTTVRLRERLVRGPLVVVAPVLVEVAVGIDPVADRDLLVAVVVAQVLAPQPIAFERELVAVGVGDHDEPQLGLLQQLADRVVSGPVAVDEVAKRPPVDLDGDPLARVLQRRVQHRRPLARAAAGVERAPACP